MWVLKSDKDILLALGEKIKRLRLESTGDFPQLQAVAWNRRIDDTCTEAQALALYERNWRFVDVNSLTPKEKAFIDRLVDTHSKGVLLA